jgi:hypothetical protein
LQICRRLARERLALVFRGAAGQAFAALGEIPETCRVFAREKLFVDNENGHNLFLLCKVSIAAGNECNQSYAAYRP